MPILGAHMSIAGGYYKAVIAARKVGCDCVQIFTKNNNQWRAKALTAEDSEKFRDAMVEHQITQAISESGSRRIGSSVPCLQGRRSIEG